MAAKPDGAQAVQARLNKELEGLRLYLVKVAASPSLQQERKEIVLKSIVMIQQAEKSGNYKALVEQTKPLVLGFRNDKQIAKFTAAISTMNWELQQAQKNSAVASPTSPSSQPPSGPATNGPNTATVMQMLKAADPINRANNQKFVNNAIKSGDTFTPKPIPKSTFDLQREKLHANKENLMSKKQLPPQYKTLRGTQKPASPPPTAQKANSHAAKIARMESQQVRSTAPPKPPDRSIRTKPTPPPQPPPRSRGPGGS